MYLGFYDQLQFLGRFWEREWEFARALSDFERSRCDAWQTTKTEDISCRFFAKWGHFNFFLSKYNSPTGTIFISVPLLNLQNFEFRWITRPVVFTIFSRVFQSYHEMERWLWRAIFLYLIELLSVLLLSVQLVQFFSLLFIVHHQSTNLVWARYRSSRLWNHTRFCRQT